MQLYSFKEHFIELKSRILKTFLVFSLAFIVCYFFSDRIYNFLLAPLAAQNPDKMRKIIYTGLTEAFFTYLKLAAFGAFVITFPVITYQIYKFIRPGLYSREKKIAMIILLFSPLLFWLGSFFVFYYVMPGGWRFFLSFENTESVLPIVLEARISEYLSLVIQLIIAFGLAFQLPVIILVLNLLKIITVVNLRQKRRLAIVINFIIAGILTPPDILSQIALAIPMLLLYEMSIIMCKLVENRGEHAGY